MVVLLCGPAGAGKTTLARASGLVVFDRDDPQWSGERQFREAIGRLARDRAARAVVIRSAPTSRSRSEFARLVGATHVYLVLLDQRECARRVMTRGRDDKLRGVASLKTWFSKFDRLDGVATFPGWGNVGEHTIGAHSRPW